MKFLRKELHQREQDATKSILKRAEVVMATLTGAADTGPMKMLDQEHFDLVIIDECSQVLVVFLLHHSFLTDSKVWVFD